MDSKGRRTGFVGQWTPVLFYSIVVVGWFAEGASHPAAAEHLWLVLWTIPAPLLFLWQTRRRR